MDVYETGLVVQRPPLRAAESEKTMDNTTQDKQAFYRKLQGRQVFIPCRKQGDENITLELLVSNQGEQMIPAFYARGSAKGKFDEASLVEFAFPMLRNILIELPEEISGIVLEPFGENIPLDRKALADYDSAVHGMTVAKHDHSLRTIYRKADRLPDGLTAAVGRFAQGQIGINAVWALLAKNENERIPHLTFAIDFFGSKFDLFPRLAEVLKPFMQPGQTFELIERNPQLQAFLTPAACIYRRSASVQ